MHLYHLKASLTLLGYEKLASHLPSPPGIVVTHCDYALMNVLEHVFPQSYHVLCQWYIRRSIYTCCKVTSLLIAHQTGGGQVSLCCSSKKHQVLFLLISSCKIEMMLCLQNHFLITIKSGRHCRADTGGRPRCSMIYNVRGFY